MTNRSTKKSQRLFPPQAKGKRGWAIKDPRGRLVDAYRCYQTEAEAWDDFHGTFGNRQQWEAKGYRAVRARVVEEP